MERHLKILITLIAILSMLSGCSTFRADQEYQTGRDGAWFWVSLERYPGLFDGHRVRVVDRIDDHKISGNQIVVNIHLRMEFCC